MDQTNSIRPGLVGEAQMVVTEAVSAVRLGSGSVPVLGTPALLQLMEQATVAAVDPHLSPGLVSVGVGVELSHLAATPLGQTVRAHAEVIDVDQRRVTLRVTAHDDVERIGEGMIQRVIVNRERFAERAAHKARPAATTA